MSLCTPAVEHQSSFSSSVLQWHCQDSNHLSCAISTLAAHENGLQRNCAAGLSLSKHAVAYTVYATLKQAWVRMRNSGTRCERTAQVRAVQGKLTPDMTVPHSTQFIAFQLHSGLLSWLAVVNCMLGVHGERASACSPPCASSATFRSLFLPVSMLPSCALLPEKMLSSATSAA